MKPIRPIAVITGIARDAGKGCTLELARGGFNLLTNDRPDADNVEKPHITQQECLVEGMEVTCFPADVDDLPLHEEMLNATQNQQEYLGCLLSNAGISVKKRGDLLGLEPGSFDRNTAINTCAPFSLAQAFSKHLLAQSRPEVELLHRPITFVSPISTITLAANRGEYTTAKTAVSITTRLFVTRPYNERAGVYKVRPGLIKTDMAIPAMTCYDELIAKGLVPWRCRGYPTDIASTVCVMTEDKLIYTCGQAVTIDGGLSMPHF